MRCLAMLMMALVVGAVACTDDAETVPGTTSPGGLTATIAEPGLTSSESTTTSGFSSVDSAAPSTTSLLTTAPPLIPPTTERFVTTLLGRVDTTAEQPGVVRMVTDDVRQDPPQPFVFDDGRIRVVYPAGGGWSSNGVPMGDATIEMATCVEAQCGAIDVVELLRLDPFQVSGWFATGYAADGTPVFAWGSENTAVDGYSEDFLHSNLAICDSVDCDVVAVATLPPHANWGEGKFEFDVHLRSPAFATAPDGSVTFAYLLDGLGEIRMSPCDMTLTCSLVDAGALVAEVDDMFQHLSFSYTDADLPLFMWDGFVVSCTRLTCDGADSLVHASNFEVPAWPGKALLTDIGDLYVIAEPWGDPTRIQVTHCDDMSCESSSTRTLYSLPGSGTWSPFDAVLGSDQLPRFVWTTYDGYQFARCTDRSCSEVQVTSTGIVAKRLAIRIGPRGLPIVVAVDESGISLTYCGDENCNL